MGMREKTYKEYEKEYGIPAEDVRLLKAYCRKMPPEERQILLHAAISVASGIEVTIYDSIVNGMGYDAVARRRDMLLTKADDFYGYQRKTLDLFTSLMRLSGRPYDFYKTKAET